jgi:pilus assembly protein CpaF
MSLAPAVQRNDRPKAIEDTTRLRMLLADSIAASFKNNGKLDRSPGNVKLVRQRFQLACQHANIRLPDGQQESLFCAVADEVLGLGPIERFMQDDSISEVMINGFESLYVERNGRIEEIRDAFVDAGHLLRTVNKLVGSLGKRLDENSPIIDARLANGSRLHVVGPPCAIDGLSVTIRKFPQDRLDVPDLISFGTMNQAMADYLEACVAAGLNVIVSGGTSSGKTTLLNVLSGFIPEHERIVTIEDSAELKLNQKHVVRLESKPPTDQGEGSVDIRRLVKSSLRMRPDRIVVGECRGAEALDMLQAMNTGHRGSMTTIHANTPRDAMSRLETLILMAGMDLPLHVVRKQIAAAIQVIVQLVRMRDSRRRITHIAEVTGMEGELFVMQDVFHFKESGEQEGIVNGAFEPSGLRSSYDERLRQHGFKLPAALFRVSGVWATEKLNGR